MNKPLAYDQKQAVTKKEKLPLSILWLAVGAFAIGMTEFLVMGLLPNVANDLNVSIPMSGQIITAYALGVAFGAPILSILTISIPKRKLLLFLLTIFIVGNGLSMFAPSYLILIGARVLTALAHGTFLGVGTLIATYLVSEDRKGMAVSLVLAGLTVANIVGVPFGTYIGQIFGWRASFGVITVLGIISLIGVSKYIPHIPQNEKVSVRSEVKEVLNPRVLFTLFVGFFGAASMFCLFTYISPILQDLSGFAEHQVTIILVLIGISVTIGMLLGGKLADWKVIPYLIINYAILALILFAIGATIDHPALVLISICLWGIASFSIMPGIQLRTMTLAAKAPMLVATSNHSVLNLGNAFGAYIGGVTINASSLSFVPVISGLLAAVGFGMVTFVYLSERKKGSYI